MNTNAERRKYKRSEFPAVARLIQNDQERQVQLLDFSLKGARIECSDNWTPVTGQACELQVEVHPMVKIAMQATIARIDGPQMALNASEPAQIIGMD